MNTEDIMKFLADNYTWFMIAGGVLLVALIGFLVGDKKKKKTTSNPVPIPQQDFQQMGVMNANQAPAQQAQQFVPNAQVPQQPVQPAAPAAEPSTIFTGAPVNNEEEKLVIENPAGSLSPNISMDATGIEVPGTPVTELNQAEPQNTQEEFVIGEPVPAADLTNTMPNMESVPAAAPVVEAPVMESVPAAEPVVEAPVMESVPAAEPVMEAPVMESVPAAEPVMEAPVMESVPTVEPLMEEMPVSMTPEAPAPMSAPSPVVEPAAPVAPAAPEVPAFQNTIQQ